MIPRRVWEVTTEGWHTPALAKLLEEGWEPFGQVSAGVYTLRRRRWMFRRSQPQEVSG